MLKSSYLLIAPSTTVHRDLAYSEIQLSKKEERIAKNREQARLRKARIRKEKELTVKNISQAPSSNSNFESRTKTILQSSHFASSSIQKAVAEDKSILPDSAINSLGKRKERNTRSTRSLGGLTAHTLSDKKEFQSSSVKKDDDKAASKKDETWLNDFGGSGKGRTLQSRVSIKARASARERHLFDLKSSGINVVPPNGFWNCERCTFLNELSEYCWPPFCSFCTGRGNTPRKAGLVGYAKRQSHDSKYGKLDKEIKRDFEEMSIKGKSKKKITQEANNKFFAELLKLDSKESGDSALDGRLEKRSLVVFNPLRSAYASPVFVQRNFLAGDVVSLKQFIECVGFYERTSTSQLYFDVNLHIKLHLQLRQKSAEELARVLTTNLGRNSVVKYGNDTNHLLSGLSSTAQVGRPIIVNMAEVKSVVTGDPLLVDFHAIVRSVITASVLSDIIVNSKPNALRQMLQLSGGYTAVQASAWTKSHSLAVPEPGFMASIKQLSDDTLAAMGALCLFLCRDFMTTVLPATVHSTCLSRSVHFLEYSTRFCKALKINEANWNSILNDAFSLNLHSDTHGDLGCHYDKLNDSRARRNFVATGTTKICFPGSTNARDSAKKPKASEFCFPACDLTPDAKKILAGVFGSVPEEIRLTFIVFTRSIVGDKVDQKLFGFNSQDVCLKMVREYLADTDKDLAIQDTDLLTDGLVGTEEEVTELMGENFVYSSDRQGDGEDNVRQGIAYNVAKHMVRKEAMTKMFYFSSWMDARDQFVSRYSEQFTTRNEIELLAVWCRDTNGQMLAYTVLADWACGKTSVLESGSFTELRSRLDNLFVLFEMELFVRSGGSRRPSSLWCRHQTSTDLLVPVDRLEDVTPEMLLFVSEVVNIFGFVFDSMRQGELDVLGGYTALLKASGIAHLRAMHGIHMGALVHLIDRKHLFFATVEVGENGPCQFLRHHMDLSILEAPSSMSDGQAKEAWQLKRGFSQLLKNLQRCGCPLTSMSLENILCILWRKHTRKLKKDILFQRPGGLLQKVFRVKVTTHYPNGYLEVFFEGKWTVAIDLIDHYSAVELRK